MKIPDFDDEIDESAFWDTHDSTDYEMGKELTNVKFVQLSPLTDDQKVKLVSNALDAVKLGYFESYYSQMNIDEQAYLTEYVTENMEAYKELSARLGSWLTYWAESFSKSMADLYKELNFPEE